MENAQISKVDRPLTVWECFTFDDRKATKHGLFGWKTLLTPKRRLLVLFRLVQHFRRHRVVRRLFLHFFATTQLKTGCEIHIDASIGRRFHLPHPNGVVIGCGVIIGNDVSIFQQVTLGAERLGNGGRMGEYPCIGNNVQVYAGAKVIGAVKVGDFARIGANAVVLMDVPANAIAVGVPAKSKVTLAERPS